MKSLAQIETNFKQTGISTALLQKWTGLIQLLQGLPPAVVAFSGGVDSSLLAFTAALTQKDHMIALTANSSFEPPEVIERASAFALRYGIPHAILELDPLQNPIVRTNPVDRCYHCKLTMLQAAWNYARGNGYGIVLEGQNADDPTTYRPGQKAVLETGTLSPLLANGLNKVEIRWLARSLELPVWDQPSSPCLATRFPYGTILARDALQQVNLAEIYLRQNGLKIVRVRNHGDLARIEIGMDELPRLLEIRSAAAAYLKSLGFQHVTLDLQGYRSGTFDGGMAQ